MRAILFILAACLCLNANAEAASDQHQRKMVCGPEYDQFAATLDFASSESGTGFFNVEDASVMIGFATANLICVGHAFNDVSCLGFWFGQKSYVVQVNLSVDNGIVRANSTNLTKSPVSGLSGVICKIE